MPSLEIAVQFVDCLQVRLCSYAFLPIPMVVSGWLTISDYDGISFTASDTELSSTQVVAEAARLLDSLDRALLGQSVALTT